MSTLPLKQLNTLEGAPLSAELVAGKVLLIVNVASRCGLTPQYEGLVQLHEELASQGFSVLGVPCNQFAGQEPGTAEEIRSFCAVTYGVDFPLLEKQEVNGAGRSPLYKALVDSAAGGGKDIQWNFEKFLVGRDGAVKARFAPMVKPSDPALRSAVLAELG